MSLFLSTYLNAIDKKGRISIPAAYRNLLSNDEINCVIAYPSIKHKAIEFCSYKRIAELSQIIQTLDPYSEERDAFETVILSESVQLSIDSEGRVILPKKLYEYSMLEDQAIFVGKGLVFELWHPDRFNEHATFARVIAKNNRTLLKNL